MKTKIVYLVSLLCALTFATSAFADSENGFYEKDHIRGFISLGGDFRGMFEGFNDYMNTLAFINTGYVLKNPSTGAKEAYTSTSTTQYNSFESYYIGLHMNVGAQYKQFLTWFNINFMPTQISERPAKSITVSSESGDTQKMDLFDVKWFTYGVDWMFGWKLFGENTVINLIPSVGFGFNLLNIHFSSLMCVGDVTNYVQLRDRYYSTMDASLTAELELRLELDPIAIGIYGGYRHIDYSDMEIENILLANGAYDTDNNGDTWFVGLRVTWTFMSDWQRKQADKL